MPKKIWDDDDDDRGWASRLGCLVVGLAVFGAVLVLVKLIWRLGSKRPSPPPPGPDGPAVVNVPSHVYRQPEPFIYDQFYLQSLGLAVTWQNPDIHLELPSAPGVPVDSNNLAPATQYVVVARVWNNSTTAPVADMPVHFSYLDFGIGTTKNSIGQSTADLSVKGGSQCPSWAQFPWTTPPTPGHYCLQVELEWPDDENPNNNLGQHNTNVKALNSPKAAFTFPVRNDGPGTRALRLVVDAYEIPPLPRCDDRRAREAEVRSRHDPSRFPVPVGWTVAVQPEEINLEPGQQADVAVDVTAPDGFAGRQAFNVNAFDHGTLVGGVTLYAEGTV